ncbi:MULTISPECIES: LysE family translocator [unclassified Rhizobium]|uniref:LysE family translocator n=1 Tax=unclassified Rhizobium TaxID=2613769 RepID=UPI00160A9227|nr:MULTISPECIES: LysE family translocator [unclassified Rhizobium]MBB3541701.1 threonine/homoserine/homoserine lactone efflux protein [Rhizobium sp. BK399]MCS3740720.1 threonine/homoserine/homoserine lactone efflux protein [Rhizobium sp. BK661]MCS4092445.1 threonine/homoserine/homoserine lactone efflux protein [Rhizobium sp. BK176]
MSLETLLLYVPACFALNMAFGPNNLLSVTIGARAGMGMAIAASAGRIVAFAIMIAITAFGLGALLMASGVAFSIVKWLGVAYLLWIGFKLFRAKVDVSELAAAQHPSTFRAYLRQEFLVASSNPKAILIFTAFLPQFVEPSAYWQSFFMLGAIFLVLEVVAIAIYAFVGSRLRGVMRNAWAVRLVNRISGSMMMLFGGALALTHRSA